MKFYYRSKVYTTDGWKEIGKIKQGDLVLNSVGKFVVVKKIISKCFYDKKLISIRYLNSEHTSYRCGSFVNLYFNEDTSLMVNNEWVCVSKININDSFSILATECEICNKLIPYSTWRNKNCNVTRFCSSNCLAKNIHLIYGVEYLTKKCHEATKIRSKTGKHQWQKGNKKHISWNEKPYEETIEIRKKISEKVKANHPMNSLEARNKNAKSQVKNWKKPEYKEKMKSIFKKSWSKNKGIPIERIEKWRLNNPEKFAAAQKKAQEWKKDPIKFKNAIKKAQEWKKDEYKYKKSLEKISKKLKEFYKNNPLEHPLKKIERNGGVSMSQMKVFDLIKSKFDNAILNYPIKTKNTIRYGDVTLPENKIIVEFDGKYWHKDKEKDVLRDNELIDVGYSIIHVNEDDWETSLEKVCRLLKNHNNEYKFINVRLDSLGEKHYKSIVLYDLITEDTNGYLIYGTAVK